MFPSSSAVRAATLPFLLMTLGLAILPLHSPASAATPHLASGPAATGVGTPPPGPKAAKRSLAVAQSAQAGAAVASREVDMSMIMRDLFAAKPALSPQDRETANTMLARPTDGTRDPYDNGYTVPSSRTCTPTICVHYVSSTDDAVPSVAWANTVLYTLQDVWTFQTGELGYRRPVADNGKGGDDRFDVYLANLAPKGYYGYCTPEAYAPGNQSLASGYCVLDNSMSPEKFGGTALGNLRATAAHELFHAVQYAYDFAEDRWLMEATASWMEERYDDDLNVNRAKLRFGQLIRSEVPLDTYELGGLAQYGNWLFFEHLTNRVGRGIVRDIWTQAGEYAGGGGLASVPAVIKALALRDRDFTSVYADFATANVVAKDAYPEGANYLTTPIYQKNYVRANETLPTKTFGLQHLSSRTVSFINSNITSPTARLRINVKLPPTLTGSAAKIIVHRTNGTMEQHRVPLDADGVGTVDPVFNQTVDRIRLVLVNGSTRYTCRMGTTYSCQGTSLDDGRLFSYNARSYDPAPPTKTVATTNVTGSQTVFGTPAKVTVQVAGKNPTGVVTLREGTVVRGRATITNGRAVFALPAALPTATRVMVGTYSGDANNTSSSDQCQVVIKKAASRSTVAISKLPRPTAAGAALVRLVVPQAVPPTKVRLVLRTAAGRQLKAWVADVRNKQAGVLVPKLNRGSYVLRATWSGNTNYLASASQVKFQVR